MKVYIIGDAMDSYYNDIYAITSTEEKAKELIKEMMKINKEEFLKKGNPDKYFPSELDYIEYKVDVIL